MLKTFSRALTLVGIALTLSLSCNKQDFQAGQKAPTEPENHVVAINGIEDLDLGSRSVKRIDTVDFMIQLEGQRTFQGEERRVRPVDLYFAVDTTGSMADEISNIKAGVQQLATDLRSKSIDLWAGFIGFVDDEASTHRIISDRDGVTTVANRHALTSDAVQLEAFINRLETKGNQDYPEASLLAIREAVKAFRSGEGRADAVKMVMAVTDVVGHNGGGSSTQRDCSIASVVQDINAYGQSLRNAEQFKFFYLVPDSSQLPTPVTNADRANYTNATTRCFRGLGTSATFNAKEQMEAILAEILTHIPAARKGGPVVNSANQLAWPLTDNTLVETLVPLIENSVPKDRLLSCRAQKITARSGDETIYDWEYATATAGTTQNAIYLDDVIAKAAKPRARGEQMVVAEVERCCSEIDARNFAQLNSQCAETYTQRIQLKLINE